MKFIDMLQMSAGNLWKRKLRTILTILGVVIGVASIVVMVSLGLGLSKSMMEEYQSYGSMTKITVQEPYGNSDSADALRLDDELIAELSGLEHVESVDPVLQISAIAINGGYSAYVNIRALSIEGIERLGIDVGEGTLPTADMDNLQFFYGCEILQMFANTKTGMGYWETGILPDIDLMNGDIFIVFDTNNYYASQSTGSGGGNGSTITAPKKYLIPACGVEATPETFSTNGWNIFCDIDKLIPQLKKVFKNSVIPGQPTTKSGKPYKQIYYTELAVNVDDMDNVNAVQQYISNLGYQTYSDAEWISSAQTSMGYVEAVLGGIGAVSLFVAAIGIANTMMMSIYERTREIGVMKVLGCDMGNIRTLFLLEAGMIGFVGGIVGLILSYGVSALINFVVAGSGDSLGLGIATGSGGISTIPIWLSLLAIVFATIIAMIAGFFPSQKAMKLSPLAAIRND